MRRMTHSSAEKSAQWMSPPDGSCGCHPLPSARQAPHLQLVCSDGRRSVLISFVSHALLCAGPHCTLLLLSSLSSLCPLLAQPALPSPLPLSHAPALSPAVDSRRIRSDSSSTAPTRPVAPSPMWQIVFHSQQHPISLPAFVLSGQHICAKIPENPGFWISRMQKLRSLI